MQSTGLSAVTAYTAHREWATRPPDERFASVSALDTTLNVYTQVLDGAAREAADRIGSELARIGQTPGGTTTLIH
jgi:hypothetical protein